MESWLESTTTNTGTVLSHEYALNDDGTTDYAYLAGDISLAYTISQANYVGRSMFTLYTDNPDYPMFFFVYDAIGNVSTEHTNKFLLQVTEEPVVDEDNGTVTVTKKSARLVLESLKGIDNIEIVGGGEGKEYMINGVQCPISVEKGFFSNDMWGRVELTCKGKPDTQLFNVLYFTDSDNDEKLNPELTENDQVIGTKVENTHVFFSKSHARSASEISFTTDGKGVSRYMLLGLHAGTWHVKVDGVTVAHAYCTEEGGMISFYAPHGDITVTPGLDIAPPDGGRIIYNTAGGIIPDDAPQTFTVGDTVILPTEVKKGNDVFLGWYTAPNFDESTRVTELEPYQPGDIYVYAKYKTFLLNADFEDTSFDKTAVYYSNSGIEYYLINKVDSNAKTVTDGENTYVRISTKDKDATVRTSMSYEMISSVITSGGFLTYEIDLAALENGVSLQTQFMIRAKTDISDTYVMLFETSQTGQVYLNQKKSNLVIGNLTTRLEKYVFTIDFNTETLIAYDVNGFELGRCELTISGSLAENYDSFTSWFKTVNMLYNFQMYYNGGICYDDFRIYCAPYDKNGDSVPADSNRLVLDPKLGKLYGDVPTYYTKGVPVSLPDPISTVSPLIFDAWYQKADFSGEPIKELLLDNADKPVTLYAKYIIPRNMNTVSFNIGMGKVNTVLPEYYTENKKIILPTPTSEIPEESFVGWYLTPDFSGECYNGEYTPENSDEPLTFYAYFKYADGTKNRIEYHAGVGTLPEGLPSVYCVGDKITLPTLSDTENAKFIGWYTTADYKAGTQISEFSAENTFLPLIVYARFVTNIVINDNDFSGNVVDINKPEDGSPIPTSPGVDGIYYQFKGKYAEVHTVTDAAGKTYIVIKTDAKNPSGTTSSCDPQIYSTSTVHKTEVRKNGGIITYDLEIAVPEGAKCGNSVFRLRSGSASDVIYLFGTNANGEILFNGDKNTVIATLGSRFTRLVFTVDLLNETLTAYNTYGEILATANIAIPDAADPKYTTLMEWFESMDNPHQWYFEKDCELAIDSYKIYTGPCKDFNYLSENENKLILNTGLGALAENAPNSYKAGERLTLPIPVVNDAMVQFKGWYKTPDFTGEAVTEIEQISADAPIVLYARFGLPDNMNVLNFDVGAGEIVGDAPEYYEKGKALTLPVPIPKDPNETFVGWCFKADLSDTPVKELCLTDADSEITLYAKYIYGDGTYNKIIYVLPSGVALGDDAPLNYEADTPVSLPTPIIPDGSMFFGWYKSSDFSGQPITEICESDVSMPVTVYARIIKSESLFEQDFSASNSGALSVSQPIDCGIEYDVLLKKNATVETKTDSEGNVYMTVTTGASNADPTLSRSTSKYVNTLLNNGSIITYEIDLAIPTDESGIPLTSAKTTFRLREVGTSAALIIFTTTDSGKVLLGGDKNYEILTLGKDFQKIVITLDLIGQTLTAYKPDGSETVMNVAVPSTTKTGAVTVREWVSACMPPMFQWYYEANGAMSYDNLKIYTGGYGVQ